MQKLLLEKQSLQRQFSLENLLKYLWRGRGIVTEFSLKLCLVITYAEDNSNQPFKSRQLNHSSTVQINLLCKSPFKKKKKKFPFVYQNLFTLIERLLSSLI